MTIQRFSSIGNHLYDDAGGWVRYADAKAEIDRLRAEIDRIITGVRCFAYDYEANPVDCLLKIKRFLALPNAKANGR